MIKIELNEKHSVKQLNAIAKQLKLPKKLYGVLGEQLKKIHRARFEDQKSPEGIAWKPLSAEYLEKKHQNKDKILRLRGTLRNQLAYNYTDTGVEFGSARVYARHHHYGSDKKSGRGSGIPARPWLGLSKSDEIDLMDTAADVLARQIKQIVG